MDVPAIAVSWHDYGLRDARAYPPRSPTGILLRNYGQSCLVNLANSFHVSLSCISYEVYRVCNASGHKLRNGMF